MGGPLWLDRLHDQNFVSRLLCKVDEMELGTWKRIQGVLNVVREELDSPLYYTLDRLVSRITKRVIGRLRDNLLSLVDVSFFFVFKTSFCMCTFCFIQVFLVSQNMIICYFNNYNFVDPEANIFQKPHQVLLSNVSSIYLLKCF